jgi:hypothetical protein
VRIRPGQHAATQALRYAWFGALLSGSAAHVVRTPSGELAIEVQPGGGGRRSTFSNGYENPARFLR